MNKMGHTIGTPKWWKSTIKKAYQYYSRFKICPNDEDIANFVYDEYIDGGDSIRWKEFLILYDKHKGE